MIFLLKKKSVMKHLFIVSKADKSRNIINGEEAKRKQKHSLAGINRAHPQSRQLTRVNSEASHL